MAKKFDKLLERATAPTLLEPDWEGILNCVDAIRSGDVPAKPAIASIKKRYQNENPHVALYALMVLEASVKNCGEKVYKEIATKEFMEDLKHLAMESGDKVKEKVLELVQCWAHAFRNKTEYKIVADTHNLMKLEGFEFPTMREADAMFSAESAPDWIDGDQCYRCRATFGVLTRKHHCRACGQIFCDKCSGKSMILPQIGIEKEVRVCESCFDKFKAKGKGAGKKEGSVQDSPTKKSTADSSSVSSGSASAAGGPAKAKDAKEREEEELAIAIALSQSEADENERQRQRQLMQLYNGPDSNEASADEFYPPKKEPTTTIGYKGVLDVAATNGVQSHEEPKQQKEKHQSMHNAGLDSTDPELARYLNRSYWENRRTEQKQGILRQSPTPSAPPPSDSGSSGNAMVVGEQAGKGTAMMNGLSPAKSTNGTKEQNFGAGVGRSPSGEDATEINGTHQLTEDDTARFASALKSQVEVFVNRIRSNQGRGRSIVNDSSIQSLFLSLTNYHTDLLNRMHNLDERRGYFESLQDRLSSIEEARQAVEALREEHEKRKQAELMEAQRVRQIQMQQKLEVMRHKKHEMLEHQRMMALQRMQQQEQEIQMRRQMAAMALAGQQLHSGVQHQQPMIIQGQGSLPQIPQLGQGVPYGQGVPHGAVHQGGMPHHQYIPAQSTIAQHGVQFSQQQVQQQYPVEGQATFGQQQGSAGMAQGYAAPQHQSYGVQTVPQAGQQGFYQQATGQEGAIYQPQHVAAAQSTYVYQEPLPQSGYVPQQNNVVAVPQQPAAPQEIPVQQQIYQSPQPPPVQQQPKEDLLISFD